MQERWKNALKIFFRYDDVIVPYWWEKETACIKRVFKKHNQAYYSLHRNVGTWTQTIKNWSEILGKSPNAS